MKPCALLSALLGITTVHAADTSAARVATVMNTPGCVAFWDFVKREPHGAHRFTAHVPPGATNDFARDVGNYINDYCAAKVVARGQREYAFFAGLNKEGSACGHVSENGAKSFGHIYAMHKSNSGDVERPG